VALDDPDPELPAAADELFGLDPADFVTARDELARRLRTSGDRTLAGRVGVS